MTRFINIHRYLNDSFLGLNSVKISPNIESCKFHKKGHSADIFILMYGVKIKF